MANFFINAITQKLLIGSRLFFLNTRKTRIKASISKYWLQYFFREFPIL